MINQSNLDVVGSSKTMTVFIRTTYLGSIGRDVSRARIA